MKKLITFVASLLLISTGISQAHSRRQYTLTGTLYDQGHSYGIHLELCVTTSGGNRFASGTYGYNSSSSGKVLEISGWFDGDNLILYTENDKEEFNLHTSNNGRTFTGDWYKYENASAHAPHDSHPNKHLHVKLNMK